MFIDATLLKAGGPVAGTANRKLSTRAVGLAVMLCALWLVLAGCSATRLGYEALPTLARWQIDRHLDLDEPQTALLTRHLEELQRWHRASELPAYAATLEGFERELRVPVAPETVASWRAAVFAAWMPLADRLAPGVADLALTLRPEQFAALTRRYERTNREFRDDHLGASPQRQTELRGDRVVRRAERFIGNLSGAQERDVRRWAAALPAVEGDWLAERQSRQLRLHALLESIATERPARDEAVRRARAMLADLWVSTDSQRRERLKAGSAANDALALRILNAATRQQISVLRENLREYVADFRALASEGAARASP